MSAALQAARSAVAEARDTRREAADEAMVALHAPAGGPVSVDELFTVWRRADADLDRAVAQLALVKAAAGITTVVALPTERAS